MIRLKHAVTKGMLRSENQKSPITNNREISTAIIDDDCKFAFHTSFIHLARAHVYESTHPLVCAAVDEWKIVCGEAYWERDTPISLKHVQSGHYVSTASQYRFGGMMGSQREVSGITVADQRSLWVAVEGLYAKEKSSE